MAVMFLRNALLWALCPLSVLCLALSYGFSDPLPADTPVNDTLVVEVDEPSGFFVLAEDSLRSLSLELVRPLDDSVRLANNTLFSHFLLEVLHTEGSMCHPFDSLATVSMLQPPDSSFRIITWYVPLSDQQFRYFGYIQFANRCSHPEPFPDRTNDAESSHEKRTPIYTLREDNNFEGDATLVEFTGSNWYGSYYYALIANRHEGENHYMLLGWRGDNAFSRKRIIEPLWFRDGEPVFGAQVFDLDGQSPYRMVFEYSARVSMGLLYDEQVIRQGGNREPLIIFDRLVPLEGVRQAHHNLLVPEGNVFDALHFQEGRWVFYPDIDARRHEPPDLQKQNQSNE